MDTLTADDLRRHLDELEGWTFEEDRLRRNFTFDTFREAIDFIVRLADLADAADHHPELTNVYSRVTVELTSHDAGGVTSRDVELAHAIDRVVTAPS